MNTKTKIAGAVAVAIVAGVILWLQNFDAEKIACADIGKARVDLQTAYNAGVSASVQVYADEKAVIDERLSQCLNAKPIDPCVDTQKVRDDAAGAYNGISSPPDNSPYSDFQTYFKKRDDAYNNYKKAKEVLDQCRASNPPKNDVPYEKSDTKACFDAYDLSVEAARNTFGSNTQAMRAALKSALTALDAREKACNPPTGKEKFTESIGNGSNIGENVPTEILNCKPINENFDSELFTLRERAAAIAVEIQEVQKSIENIRKRMNPLQRDLRDVDTYIPPESTKTQFEGTLNALRAERKLGIESTLSFYNNLLTKREAEKTALQEELRNTEAKIKARLEYIKKENEARMRSFPTALHLAKPDKCEYYHCHGIICGRPDPDPHGCGQGASTQDDVDCKEFIDSYLKTAEAK